jgi:hypothetical protein
MQNYFDKLHDRLYERHFHSGLATFVKKFSTLAGLCVL